jgi:hypothetical protein
MEIMIGRRQIGAVKGLGALAIVVVVISLFRSAPVSFSEEGWRSSTDRERMAKSIVATGRLTGKTRSQVEAILGKPAYFFEKGWIPGTQSQLQRSGATIDGGRNMQYIVGDARGFAFLGFRCLYVYLDSNDVVAFCEVADRGI